MNKVLIAAFCFLSLQFSAQTVLTAEDAVKISLQNNYAIRVAANNAAQDSIRNSAGEAGMLPSVYILGGISKNQNNLRQQFTNGNEIISPNAGGTSVNAGVALDWTLFDGTRMFVTKERLGQIAIIGTYNFRAQVINTSADVLIAYYEAVLLQAQIKATDEVIRYNEERVKITDSRFKSGLGPKTDLLQAQIDLNNQKQVRLDLVLALTNAKQYLNSLLARDVLMQFEVADSIPITQLVNRAELEQKMFSNNPSLLAFEAEQKVAALTYRENRTQYFPTIVGSAGYNFVRNQNTAGFTLYSQVYGWNAGLTLSMPIYSGGALRRQDQINRIQMQTADYNYENAKLSARLVLAQSLNIFDSYMLSLALEEENKTLATENMKLSLERLRLGQGTALEVGQAQATFAGVLYQLAGLQYQVKVSEINIHRQAADL